MTYSLGEVHAMSAVRAGGRLPLASSPAAVGSSAARSWVQCRSRDVCGPRGGAAAARVVAGGVRRPAEARGARVGRNEFVRRAVNFSHRATGAEVDGNEVVSHLRNAGDYLVTVIHYFHSVADVVIKICGSLVSKHA